MMYLPTYIDLPKLCLFIINTNESQDFFTGSEDQCEA